MGIVDGFQVVDIQVEDADIHGMAKIVFLECQVLPLIIQAGQHIVLAGKDDFLPEQAVFDIEADNIVYGYIPKIILIEFLAPHEVHGAPPLAQGGAHKAVIAVNHVKAGGGKHFIRVVAFGHDFFDIFLIVGNANYNVFFLFHEHNGLGTAAENRQISQAYLEGLGELGHDVALEIGDVCNMPGIIGYVLEKIGIIADIREKMALIDGAVKLEGSSFYPVILAVLGIGKFPHLVVLVHFRPPLGKGLSGLFGNDYALIFIDYFSFNVKNDDTSHPFFDKFLNNAVYL